MHLCKDLCKRELVKRPELKSKHASQFTPARDFRNRRIPGLYIRNGVYYGLLWAAGKDAGKKTARRFRLSDEDDKPCQTVDQAREALEVLKGNRRANALPTAGRKPIFFTWADEYLKTQAFLGKRKATRAKESQALSRWRAHIGNIRLDQISMPMLNGFVEMRMRDRLTRGKKVYAPASPRTVALEMIALRNCLKAAINFGHLRDLPRFPKLKVAPPARRALVSPEEFECLLDACLATKEDGDPVTKNGVQLRDFLRLLAFSGCREQEGLRIKWAHVDFENRRLFLGADESFKAAAVTVGQGGSTKNRRSRVVDFNAQLESLLVEMKARRAPDCSWLFPSPQRGPKDFPARSLRESLKLVRTHAKLPVLGFHDLRHLFCSVCVMAGIDFMTIAAWLGHKDGGILIGKVYGHLLDDHRKKMAAKLTIGIAPAPLALLSLAG